MTRAKPSGPGKANPNAGKTRRGRPGPPGKKYPPGKKAVPTRPPPKPPQVRAPIEPVELTLTLDRIAAGSGEAVGRADSGVTVFCDRGLPGETVLVDVYEQHDRWWRARLREVITPAPTRIAAACAVAETCGGCRFQDAAYADEVAWKVEAAIGSVRRLARTVTWPEPTVVADAAGPQGYRTRARVRFAMDGGTGFAEAGSERIVATPHCTVLDPAVEAARAAITEWVRLVPTTELTLERDALDGRVCARLLVPRGAVRDVVRSLYELVNPTVDDDNDDAPAPVALHGVPLPPGRVRTMVVTDGVQLDTVWGDGIVHRRYGWDDRMVTTREQLGGFSQANARLLPALVAPVRDAVLAVTAPGDTVLELFSGAGTFTFPLLAADRKVCAVEGEGTAIDAARAAAATQPWAAAGAFLVADLHEALHPAVGAQARVAVVDPPRGGMSAALVNGLIARNLKRIVYVSCDPPAMARDVALLTQAGWAPTSWHLLDMFPRTAHLEAVVVLDR